MTPNDDVEGPLAGAQAELVEVFGRDYERCLDEGRALNRHDLARLALDEIDALTTPKAAEST